MSAAAEGAATSAGSLRSWPFLTAFSVLLLVHFGEGMSQAILSPYLQDVGFSVVDIGLLVGLAPVASLVSRLPVGFVYRGARARRLLLVAAAALAASFVLYLVPPAVPVARLLNGFGFGAATTVNFAYLLGLVAVAPGSRTRAIACFTALMAGGFSGGALLSGFVADALGYGTTLLLGAAGNLGVGLLALLLPTPPVPPRAAAADGDTRAPWRRALQWGVLEPPVLACVLNAMSYMQGTLLPLYALDVGLSLSAVGAIRSLHALANAVTRPLLAGPVVALGARRLGLLGLAGVALCIALTPSFTTFLALALLVLPMGLARAAVFLVASLAAAEGAERYGVSRGMASGLLNIGLDLGAVLGPAVSGLLAAAIGIDNTFRLLPPALLALYLLLCLPARWQARTAALAPKDV